MSQSLTQNELMASFASKSQGVLAYLRKLPLSFWRSLVMVLAAIWLVRSAAALFWLIFPLPEVAQPTKLAAPIASSASVSTTSVSYESVAMLEDVFGDAAAVVVAKNTPAPKPAGDDIEAEATKLRLKLHGVFATNDSRTGSAIIADGNKQILYAIDDEIEGHRGVKLARVHDKRVILDNKGRFESLWLFSEEDLKSGRANSGPSRPRTPKRVQTDIRSPVPESARPSETIRTTARRDQIPKNIGDVVRFSVHREGGKMVGYRIRPGRDRELFNQVGLKANDIVTSVNGIEVNDPKQIRSVYKSMKTATEAQLTVLRDGNTQSITISLDSGE